jgi:septum site-determining protein MinC
MSAVVRVLGRGRQAEVVLDDKLSLPELKEGVRMYLARNPGWFEGARVTLNIGRRVLNTEEVNQIRDILEGEFKLGISGLWCGPETLETLLSEKDSLPASLVDEREERQVFADVEWQETLMVKTTCRSGTTIHNNGNLVILGDVNPGAEITAGGDIIIFGRLAGIAHAGVNGDVEASIVALPIDAPQVRIGPYIRFESVDRNSPVGKMSGSYPSIARVMGRDIIIQPYVATSKWRQRY